MSQTAITLAFEQWKAQQAATGEPVLLDEFVFALVPGLDPELPVDRSEILPPDAQIVYREPVNRKGVVNENAVIHSAVLGADVGDFSFNWIGLINKASNTLAMIVHAPEQQKLKTKEGQQGNVLTRSFLLEFAGAQTEMAINTPAETWQIDFTARMAGIDERQRLENIDIYGEAAFFGDGWMVDKTGNQFFVTRGLGYVAGLRTVLSSKQNITVISLPVKVWLDVCWTGSFISVRASQARVVVADSLDDYEDNGIKHHVFALASIDADGIITDLRPRGSLGNQEAIDLLNKHEQSLNHPDATVKGKGFVQLSNKTNSNEETKAATPRAVKIVNDNADSRLKISENLSDVKDAGESLKNLKGVPETREINGQALTEDITLTATEVGAYPMSGGRLGENAGITVISPAVFPDAGDVLYSPGFRACLNGRGGDRDFKDGASLLIRTIEVVGSIAYAELLWNGFGTVHSLRFDQHGHLNVPGRVCSGDAHMDNSGNVYGSTWGGYLSSWIDDRINASVTLNGEGWRKDHRDGFITQWGSINRIADVRHVNFPLTFPNVCCGVVISKNNTVRGKDSTSNLAAAGWNVSGFDAMIFANEISGTWWAWGY